jgi:AhpD family alkylhydroperoxidase
MTELQTIETPTIDGRELLAEHAPAMWRRFGGYNQAVLDGDTAIPKKVKELIAVAVALTTQCEGCLDGHSKAAIAAGASAEELAETIHVAAALRAGGAISHGMRFVMPHTAGTD